MDAMEQRTTILIDAAAARRILTEKPKWTPVEGLESPYRVYLGSDSRALVVADNRGLLYTNSSDLLQAIDLNTEMFRGVEDQHILHILEGRLPQRLEFPEQVRSLCDSLPEMLDLPPESLDYSVESLSLIDGAIERVGKARALDPDYFPALVAYVGEVVRVYTNGWWEMRLEADLKSWGPYVADPSGRKHAVFSNVFDQLDTSLPWSLAGIAEAMIMPNPYSNLLSSSAHLRNRKVGAASEGVARFLPTGTGHHAR